MAFYDYLNNQNKQNVAVAQDEDKLDKKGCQLCASEKDAKSGECKWCAKDALVKELVEGEETVSPNGEAEGTVIAVKDEDKFDEEKHPRGGKGSKEGGRFVKSEKTKRKEDEVDDIEDEERNKQKTYHKETDGLHAYSIIFRTKDGWDGSVQVNANSEEEAVALAKSRGRRGMGEDDILIKVVDFGELRPLEGEENPFK